MRAEWHYVLIGREEIKNTDWGEGGNEVEFRSVFDDWDNAVHEFKLLVYDIARNMRDLDDRFFYDDEDELYESFNGGEDRFGWECEIDNGYALWRLVLPDRPEYDYGYWFIPMAEIHATWIS
ncbi:MAG: hypothetical protein IKU25_05350 [Clostridia bacterium]|nr:hypothetical protein [Clostridia bacterium]